MPQFVVLSLLSASCLLHATGHGTIDLAVSRKPVVDAGCQPWSTACLQDLEVFGWPRVDGQRYKWGLGNTSYKAFYREAYLLGDLKGRHQRLASLIASAVAAESWEQTGSSGSIRYVPFADALLINQTHDGHEQVRALLDLLRQLVANRQQARRVADIESDFNDLRVSTEVKSTCRPALTLLDECSSVGALILLSGSCVVDEGSDWQTRLGFRQKPLVEAGSQPWSITCLQSVEVVSHRFYYGNYRSGWRRFHRDGCLYYDAYFYRDTYPLGNLTGKQGRLATLITRAVAPESWEQTRGLGSIRYLPFANALVINQTGVAHELVTALLDVVRRLDRARANPPVALVESGEDFYDDLLAILDEPIASEFLSADSASHDPPGER